jgi:hypothetical protein
MNVISKGKNRMSNDKGSFSQLFYVVAVIFIIGSGIAYVVDNVENWGVVWHTKQVPVHISGNWMQGEYRKCTTSPNDKGEFDTLYCNDRITESAPHTMSVDFHGPVVKGQEDMIAYRRNGQSPPWEWTCRRKSDSIVCSVPKSD